MTHRYDVRELATVQFGPLHELPFPPTGYARMYHGTSNEAAEAIVDHGYEPLDPSEILNTVSRDTGVPVAALESRLREVGSFVAARRQYGDTDMYLTDSPLRAELWARWGGEAISEAYGAAFAIINGLDDVTNDPELGLSLRQGRSPAAVIAIDVPYASLTRGTTRLSETTSLDERIDPSGVPASFRRISDCSFHPDVTSWRVISIEPVERVWEQLHLERTLGLRSGEISKLLDAGRFPAPDDSKFGSRYWWHSSVEDTQLARVSKLKGPETTNPHRESTPGA